MGRETRFGGEAFRLRVRLKSGDVRYVYIDRQTFRQVAEEGERPSPRGLVLIETRLSDHRMVDGLLVPFVLEISAGADERQRVAFETVEVNVALDDARFAVPPGAKPPLAPPSRARSGASARRRSLGEDADLTAGVPEEDGLVSGPNSPARTPARTAASALAV